jgi:hypothetical protein
MLTNLIKKLIGKIIMVFIEQLYFSAFPLFFIFFFSVHQGLIRICSKPVILQKVNSESVVSKISHLSLEARNVAEVLICKYIKVAFLSY